MAEDQNPQSSEAEKRNGPGRLSQVARRVKAEMTKGQPTAAEKAERAERWQRQQAEAQRTISIQTRYMGGPQVEGLRENTRARVAVHSAGVTIYTRTRAGTEVAFPWSQIKDLRVETAQQIRDRITATRAVFLGAFALGFRKTERGGPYLTIDTVDGPQVFELQGGSHAKKLEAQLARFHQELHGADSEPPPAPAGEDPIAKIRELGELRDAGLITDDEFEAKKAELLGRL